MEIIDKDKLMMNSHDFSSKYNMANDVVLWNFTHMFWKGKIYKVTGYYTQDGRGVRNIEMTLVEEYQIEGD
mgnify:CR=1 FL=1